jgi:hypothetical protein
MQKKYERLRINLSASARSSETFKGIKDHAVELMHSDIGERTRQLKLCRDSLPTEIYKQRKDCIARRLGRLRPANSQGEVGTLSDGSGSYFTEPRQIAERLRAFWQDVFDAKPTDRIKRRQWLQHVSNKLNVDLKDLRLTLKDV